MYLYNLVARKSSYDILATSSPSRHIISLNCRSNCELIPSESLEPLQADRDIRHRYSSTISGDRQFTLGGRPIEQLQIQVVVLRSSVQPPQSKDAMLSSERNYLFCMIYLF